MRTENDLTAVFAEIAAEMPDEDVAVGEHNGGPSRRVLMAGLAAAAAVAVVGGVAVTHDGSGTVAGTPAASVGWGSDLDLTVPSRWSWDQTILVRGGIQLATVNSAGAGPCTLAVGDGQAAPQPLNNSRPTNVGDDPASIGTGAPYDDGSPADNQLHVRWNPAGGRWADSTCVDDTGSAAAAVQLGEQLTLHATPVAVPFTFDALPFGFGLNQVVSQPQASGSPRVSAELLTGLGGAISPSSDPQHPETKSVAVVVETLRQYGDPLSEQSRRLPNLNGRQVWLRTTPLLGGTTPVDRHTLNVVEGDHVFSVSSADLTVAQLTQLAESVTLAPKLGHDTTWFDSTTLER